jgi:hypothetical protein
MKRIFVALFAIAAFCVSSIAQPSTAWEGYLADKMCGSKWAGEKGEQRAMKHTKACGLEEGCRASGYGLFTGGKFVKFTDASDARAAAYLEKTAQEDNIYVKVRTGCQGSGQEDDEGEDGEEGEGNAWRQWIRIVRLLYCWRPSQTARLKQRERI